MAVLFRLVPRPGVAGRRESLPVLVLRTEEDRGIEEREREREIENDAWRDGCRYLGFLKTNFEIPNTSFQFLDWDSFVLIRNWACRLYMNSYRRALNSPNSFPNKKWLKCPYLQRQKCNFTIKQLNKMLKLGQSVAAIYIHFWVSTQKKKNMSCRSSSIEHKVSECVLRIKEREGVCEFEWERVCVRVEEWSWRKEGSTFL